MYIKLYGPDMFIDGATNWYNRRRILHQIKDFAWPGWFELYWIWSFELKENGGLNSCSKKVKSRHWHRKSPFVRRTKCAKIIVVSIKELIILPPYTVIWEKSFRILLTKYEDKDKIGANVMSAWTSFWSTPWCIGREDGPSLVTDYDHNKSS